ncbi:hypothetical protein EJB05_35374, partial [Eragrostis curvula]
MILNHQFGPKSVTTDSGDAVSATVKIVFPESDHRMCSWHVEQGVKEHLHCSSRSKFRSLMYDVCSPVAFDRHWHGYMAKHQKSTNQFFLGMANDQKTECLATNLHRGLEERIHQAELDRLAAMSRVVLTTRHRDQEECAAQWFTLANFYLLREEIKMIDSFERRGDIKAKRLDELKDLGTEVFDLATEDALEFHEIKEFLEGWLWLEKKRRRPWRARGCFRTAHGGMARRWTTQQWWTMRSNSSYEMAQLRIDVGDADAILEELGCRGEEAKDFENFHHYKLDADRRLKHLFWVDYESLLQSFEYGDIVEFDTTYQTHRYGMPFVLFIRLIRRHMPVILGCGVTSD